MEQPAPNPHHDFDAIVIGTGFAGAVTACRLTAAKLRICVLERGKRYEAADFPVHPEADIPSAEEETGPGERPTPDPGRLLWPLGHGLWDVRDLGDIVVAQAAAYGGGSIFYANVHLRAPEAAFADGWPAEYRKETLDPYYDLAAYMLDVQPLPEDKKLPKTTRLERAAEILQRPCFRPPLAVNFASPREGMKPNRFGRMQGGCKLRGDCCFGCGAMAKNTLDLNYLALVEDSGLADIRTLAEVTSIERTDGGYRVEYRDLIAGVPDALEAVTAPYVFLCAGAVNSTELLMRSQVIKQLPCSGMGLGEGFYPNADSIAVAFDCEKLQEADRGPTITSALLYDDEKHWLLFEDGGLPTDLEPFLGVFRSPLWLGWNRFWEQGGLPNSARAPRLGYATLPFQSLADALPGLLPAAVQSRSPGLRELAEGLVAVSRGLRRPEWLAVPPDSADEAKQWRLLPDQIVEALELNRDHFFEDVVTAAEPFIAAFLDQAGQAAEDRWQLEKLLNELLPRKSEFRGINDVDLARRLLRLAVQLVWGSQGDLVRDVAGQLLDLLMPERENVLKRAADLLRWALDFRLSDNRTGVLLCMGRDSGKGGTLSLEIPEPPPVGSVVTGGESQATGTLLSTVLRSGSWAWNDAAGTLTLAKGDGTFASNERLLVGDRVIGRAVSGEIELAPGGPLLAPGVTQQAGDDTLKLATERLRLAAIQFEPATSSPPQKAAALRRLLEARLRAKLPAPLETPERIAQEQLVRDIAFKAWKAELRTDPVSKFLRRQLTVHGQGGCGMGSVTWPDGEVIGCPGLYVMDAAAFPRSVGVNPSATIAAIAEYKVEKFIRAHRNDAQWRAVHFAEAKEWKGRRKDLDPLASIPSNRKEPISQPLGIEFHETLIGHCGPTGQDEIKTDLDARIDDLEEFLEGYRSGKLPRISIVTGEVTWRQESLPVRPRASYIRLFRKADEAGDGGETRLIEYLLELDRSGQPCVLEGRKTIRDDEGFDLWKDVTRLDFELKQDQTVLERGMLQLTASAFFGDQLRSFKATGTNDPIRRLWALVAFGRLFFGHMVDIYVPELKLGNLARSIMERTHA